ncbi:hypothetical protein C8J57DRAFT_1512177 [Mycena rebaudengoi]|nr:hypothetical protein C8J57DRAFT_1512177 [Mycena rebaudengoi]
MVTHDDNALRPCIHPSAYPLAYGTTLPSSADGWDHLLDEAHTVLPRLAQDAEVVVMARFLASTSWGKELSSARSPSTSFFGSSLIPSFPLFADADHPPLGLLLTPATFVRCNEFSY